MDGMNLVLTVAYRILGAPKATMVQLRQYYNQHAPTSDGEKYLHIRFYEREKNAIDAMKWRKLVGNQMRNLNQMLRNEWLCEVLDKLEPFRSLWANFQISSFPHILSWRCSEVCSVSNHSTSPVFTSSGN
jgi:hypothetical protein